MTAGPEAGEPRTTWKGDGRLGLGARLAYAEIRRAPGRALISAVCVGAAVFMAVCIRPALETARTLLVGVVQDTAGAAALQVVGRGTAGVPSSITKTLHEAALVLGAVAVVDVMFRLGDANGLPIRIIGLPLGIPDTAWRFPSARESGSRVLWQRVAGRTGGLVVANSLAEREGLRPGEPMTLVTPSGRREILIEGVLDDTRLPFGSSDVAVMRIGLAQALAGFGTQVTRIDVMLRPDADTDRAAGHLQALLGPDVTVERPPLRRANVDGMLRAFSLMVVFLRTVGLLAAGLVLYGIFTIRLAARRSEVAIWRAIGATPLQITVALVVDAAVLGAVGAALGVVAGSAAAEPILAGLVRAFGGVPPRQGSTASLAVAGGDLVAWGLAGAATAVVAALVAVHAATAQAVHGELRKVPDERVLVRQDRQRLLLGVALATVGCIPLISWNSPTTSWGAVASVSFVPATFLSMPWLIRRLTPLLILPARATLGAPGLLSLRNMVRQRATFALPVTVLALAVEVGTTVGAVAGSFERSLTEWLSGLTARSLLVTRADALIDTNAPPVEPELGETLRALPGVRRVEPARQRRIEVAGAEVSLRVSGLPSVIDYADRQRYRFVAGDPDAALRRLAAGDAVLVSESYSHRMGVRLRDTVTFDSPAGPIDAEVAGVIVDYSAPGGTIVIGRPAYVEHWADQTIDGFFVDLDAAVDAPSVRERIRGIATPHALSILTPPEMVADVLALMHRAVLPLHALAAVVFGVGLFGMTNALLATVIGRARELGVLRAVGATPGQSSTAVLLEGLTATAVAGIVGALTGIVGAYGWIRGAIPAATGWLVQYDVPLSFTLQTVAIAVGLAILPLAIPAIHTRALAVSDSGIVC